MYSMYSMLNIVSLIIIGDRDEILRGRDRGEETEGKRQRGRDRGKETEGKGQR